MTSTTTSSTTNCAMCTAPCNSAARNNCCSLRCAWKSTQQCVQCGRQVKDEKLPFADHPDFKIFCGTLCLDEARRGNWCVGCGVKQVTSQGLSRCSTACMSVDVPLPHESPFPSRRTTPGEGTADNNNQQNQQQQNTNNMMMNAANLQQQQQQYNNNNQNGGYHHQRRSSVSSTASGQSNQSHQTQHSTTTFSPNSTTTSSVSNSGMNNNAAPFLPKNNQARITCSPVQPGSKLWDRITTPFFRSGLQCCQVIQVHNTAADKKAYNSYRLAVDNKLAANRIAKYGFGGEGNEHKRFVPLMGGCGGHLYGLRLASQTAATSSKDCDVEGFPCICTSAGCDVCRILESGLKLTSVAGRSSHFSVPTLDAVLPWCEDAASTFHANNQKFQAVALVRTVLGNVSVVNEFENVPESQPPTGFDSVVCVEKSDMNNGTNNNNANPRTDSAFNYNDQGILAEYIVLFTNPNQQ